MSKKLKKIYSRGEKVTLYLNKYLTDEGLFWINNQRNLNSTLIKLINEKAKEELQGTGKNNITSAQGLDNNKLLELVSLLVQQNKQINVNPIVQHTSVEVENDKTSYTGHGVHTENNGVAEISYTKEENLEGKNENNNDLNSNNSDNNINNVEDKADNRSNELSTDKPTSGEGSKEDTSKRKFRRKRLHSYTGTLTKNI